MSEGLTRRERLRHALQREVGRLLAPLWVPVAWLVLRVGLGYRVERHRAVRQQYRRIREQSSGPLLVCANHLTLIDSFLVAWALAPVWRHALLFDELPWNTPERTNFADTPTNRVLTYLAKCIPITRGGSREEVAAVLNRVVHLTRRGEVALIFPEGGRSRTGRVEIDAAAWGVGRIVGNVPDCRVVCVYLRGRHQQAYGDRPVRGERLYVAVEVIEPKSDHRGARRSRDFAQQIVTQLIAMEQAYLADSGASGSAPATAGRVP